MRVTWTSAVNLRARVARRLTAAGDFGVRKPNWKAASELMAFILSSFWMKNSHKVADSTDSHRASGHSAYGHSV